eukprot:scaffold2183_cov140-Isochrysis_galbana.AAC.6
MDASHAASAAFPASASTSERSSGWLARTGGPSNTEAAAACTPTASPSLGRGPTWMPACLSSASNMMWCPQAAHETAEALILREIRSRNRWQVAASSRAGGIRKKEITWSSISSGREPRSLPA